jgi:flavin-dependent dehydrogenase
VEDHYLKNGPKDMLAKWEHLCENAHPYLAQRLNDAQPLGAPAACGPLQRGATKVHTQRTLLIGDAAGFVDAITGEGMSLALHTAELAAQAIARTHFEKWSFDKAARCYARERQKHFRNYAALTHGLLWLIKDKKRLEGALKQLEKRPDLFSELLEVNQGRRAIFSLSSLRFAQLLIPQWATASQ